jgi:hypothetical protein
MKKAKALVRKAAKAKPVAKKSKASAAKKSKIAVKKPAAIRYPVAVNLARVGRYPAKAGAGGGYVWDEVLEYRVWCHPVFGAEPKAGQEDYFHAFPTHAKAMAFFRRTEGADEPIALIRQKQYIDEVEPGKFLHVKKVRITEWPVEFLSRPKRNARTIPDFLSPNAPANRLEILHGTAKPVRKLL